MQTVGAEEGAPARGAAVQRAIATRIAQVVGAFEVQVTGQCRWRGARHGSPFPGLAIVARWCATGNRVMFEAHCVSKMHQGQHTNTWRGCKRRTVWMPQPK